MNNNEKKCINALTSLFGCMSGLTAAKNQMSKFDASNDIFIVEFKLRKSKYDGTTLIEKQKYNRNIADGRTFVYAITVGDELYIFNVSRMIKENYDFKWETKMQPATTDFNRREWVEKEVGYINFNDAAYVIDLKKNKVIFKK